MTTGTVVRHVGMIEICRYPRIGGVADQTVFRGRHMVGIFSWCRSAVMTAGTGADHIGVIHPYNGYP